MKVLLWIGGGANHKALACKIHQQYPLAGLVVENRPSIKKRTLVFYAEKVIERIFLRSISRTWHRMMSHYHAQFKDYPDVQTMQVNEINSDEVVEFSTKIRPDLIVVSGTGLIKEKLLALQPKIGIVNLHTGLSPYVKGGPNCTNWCIANGDYHLIGNTVMWIDAGIDSGNIIASELTALDGVENMFHIQLKVMEHAHDLYLRSIAALAQGYRPSVSQQEIAKGKTFYTRQWGLKEKIRLVRNLKVFRQKHRTEQMAALKKEIVTVPLS